MGGKNMKKRMMALVSMALAGAMVLPMAAMAGETEAAAAAADEGKVLNIEGNADLISIAP